MKTIGPVLAVAAVAVLLLMRIVAERRRPDEKQFRCARCSKVAAHTTRTINAWRSGKTRFFCAACHSEWLSNQPHNAPPRREASPGCLSALAFLVFISAVLLALWLFL